MPEMPDWIMFAVLVFAGYGGTALAKDTVKFIQLIAEKRGE